MQGSRKWASVPDEQRDFLRLCSSSSALASAITALATTVTALAAASLTIAAATQPLASTALAF